jgi:Nucleotidyl transferase AbiEii toxin, Type IV TA system
MDRSLFFAQVDLLLRILPYVMRDPRFALKGGSALNLFIRDLPRLSVDIDLTYLPIEDRDSTLANISEILSTISRDINRAMPQVTIQLRQGLTIDEKRFLLSVKELEPDWTLLGVAGVEQLPAVRWKLQNLAKMPKQKHRLAIAKLKEVLDL